jgi:hypothetical protein
MIDADLAPLYGVSTKRLNEQVRRNRKRFPSDFMFQLSRREMGELVANCDRFQKLKYSSALSHAFTEHGAIMLASVLNSSIAIEASLSVVRAFVRLRKLLSSHKDLAQKIAAMEEKYDSQFKVIFDAVRELMEPSNHPPVPLVKGFSKD